MLSSRASSAPIMSCVGFSSGGGGAQKGRSPYVATAAENYTTGEKILQGLALRSVRGRERGGLLLIDAEEILVNVLNFTLRCFTTQR